MKITQERFVSDAESTMSLVFVGGRWSCYFLEDEYRTKKVYGETRIPADTYEIAVRAKGGFHQRYSELFPWHRGMLELKDVPNFNYILIHIGVTEKNTAGCLLPGWRAFTKRGQMRFMNIDDSREAYEDLYMTVIDAAERGELTIEIIDRDR